MSKRERDPICDVCGHCHIQGVKCKICGHVGKYIGEYAALHHHRMWCITLKGRLVLNPAASLNTSGKLCASCSILAIHPETRVFHVLDRLFHVLAVPGGPNKPNRGAIPPVPPGPLHAPNLTPPTIEGLKVLEFREVRHVAMRIVAVGG